MVLLGTFRQRFKFTKCVFERSETVLYLKQVRFNSPLKRKIKTAREEGLALKPIEFSR